jgi:ABC-type spermidine/putrescine transport system permease subunit I
VAAQLRDIRHTATVPGGRAVPARPARRPPGEARAAAHERRFGWLLLPFLGLFALLFILPLAQLAMVSLTDPVPGPGNYVRAFTTPVYWKVFATTFNVAAGVTVVALVLGYPTAYVLATMRGRWVGVLWALVLIPFWTSLLVRTYAWMVILGRRGVVNQVVQGLGLSDGPLDLLFNRFSVTVGMVYILLPFMILCLYAGMRGIDTSLLAAAENLGATPGRALLRIFVPLSLPGVVSGVLIVFISALGYYITPALLGGRTDLMIALLIDEQISQLFNWGMGASLAFILLFVTLGVFLIANRVVRFDRILGAGHEA